MAKSETPEIPALPVGCIDADALHKACKAGASPEDALKAAVVVNDEAIPAEDPAPAASTAAEEGAA